MKRRLGSRLAAPFLALLLLGPSLQTVGQEAGAGQVQAAGSTRLQDAETGREQEPTRPPGDTVYLEGVSLFSCMVLLPDGYDASKSYPLVVGLHGHGGRADDFFLPAPWFGDIGVIFAVPQAPYAFPSAGRIGYSWNLRGFDDEAGDQGAEELTERYILDVVESLSESYSVGDVYLMGFSQGGTFTYTTAIRNHERFTGLVAIGSRFDPEWFSDSDLAAAKSLRVFISVGRSDGAAPSSALTRDMLRRMGYDVEYFDFEGGHIITRSAIEALLSWLQR